MLALEVKRSLVALLTFSVSALKSAHLRQTFTYKAFILTHHAGRILLRFAHLLQ